MTEVSGVTLETAGETPALPKARRAHSRRLALLLSLTPPAIEGAQTWAMGKSTRPTRFAPFSARRPRPLKYHYTIRPQIGRAHTGQQPRDQAACRPHGQTHAPVELLHPAGRRAALGHRPASSRTRWQR